MEIINEVYFSDIISDFAKQHFDKKNSDNIKEALVLFAGYTKFKNQYEDMLYSQPNWADNYTLAEMDSAKSLTKEAEEIYLSKWHIPNFFMKAIYCVPLSESLDNTEWLLCYVIEIKDKRAVINIQIDKQGIWNYSMNTKGLSFEGNGKFNVYDYYRKKLKLAA